MSLKMIKPAILAAVMAMGAVMPVAAEAPAKNLDELLKMVEQGRLQEAKENRQREQRFKQQRAEQDKLLAEAKAERAALEKRSSQLEKQLEENDKKLADAEKRLNERMGSLKELFGHITSAAGDARGNFESSLINLHYPDRQQFLDQLIAKSNSSIELPSIEEMERLWFELQREMTESGKVVSFEATVNKPNGDQVKQKVVRVGTYNVVAETGNYLKFENGVLEELPRQPASPHLSKAAALVAVQDGFSAFSIDPTGPLGGSFLAALIDSPTWAERWHQGREVGYVISVIGGVALLIAFWRIVALLLVTGKVNSQLKSAEPSAGNPLGRVLMVNKENPNCDLETLELKLNEAVLKELPKLETGLSWLKIISAVAPLLGLLGTVTGMILTFQAITIFGAGDPKAMAGGISSALITTVLGLIVAIPTVLLHTLVSGMSKRVVHILEEQSAGIVAQHQEAK